MKKVGFLFMVLLTLTGVSSCQSPGLKEPDIFICTLIDLETLDCVNSLDRSITRTIPLDLSIGSQCIFPEDYATLKSHHSILHKSLNECENQKVKK